MAITFRRAVGAADMAACLDIRRIVFIEGQGVPISLERDGLDGACLHWIGLDGNTAIATARVRVLADRYKIQRVAVLPTHQGSGHGAALMRFVMDDLSVLRDRGDRLAFLSSQVHAIPFYERLGFSVCSDVYVDAGIDHRDMQRRL